MPSSGHPALAEPANALGRLDVELGVHRGVVARRRHPERPPLAAQELLVDPRPLGDLGGREPLLAAPEHPLHRQQRQAVLRDRGAQLVEGDAVVGELGEQPQPRLPRLALQPVEQPLRLEVDLSHRRAHSDWPSRCAS